MSTQKKMQPALSLSLDLKTVCVCKCTHAAVLHYSREPLHPLRRASSACSPLRTAGIWPLTQKCWLSGLVPPSPKLCICVQSPLWRCGGQWGTSHSARWGMQLHQAVIFSFLLFLFLLSWWRNSSRGTFKSGLMEKGRCEGLNTPAKKYRLIGERREGTASSS